jgi:hypothetical protein
LNGGGIDADCLGMMPRGALVLLSALLAISQLAAQRAPARTADSAQPAIGMLLGVSDREGGFSAWYDAPQQLTTYWVVVSSAGATPPMMMTGLIVPRDEGFVRVVVRRTCEPIEDNRGKAGADESCDDSIVTSALGRIEKTELAPVANYTPGTGDIPQSYTARFVTFASPVLVSVTTHSGQPDRGYRWTDSGEVQRLGTDTPVRLSEVAGAKATRAYAVAAACSPGDGDDRDRRVFR